MSTKAVWETAAPWAESRASKVSPAELWLSETGVPATGSIARTGPDRQQAPPAAAATTPFRSTRAAARHTSPARASRFFVSFTIGLPAAAGGTGTSRTFGIASVSELGHNF